MNYTTGKYENEIPGAIASGDSYFEEWIFVPSDVSIAFKVVSRDTQKYLEEINRTNETLTMNYTLSIVEYDENATKFESKTIFGNISANKTDEIAMPTKFYLFGSASDVVRNKTVLIGKELKVPAIVTAVYEDRFYVTDGDSGFMVYTNQTPNVSIGDYIIIYGNVSLQFNDTTLIPVDFERHGNTSIDNFIKSIATGQAGTEYSANGSVTVNTAGNVVEVGPDYASIDDGSGSLTVYFRYGINKPSVKKGDKMNVTGVLINSSIGILPTSQDSVNITSISDVGTQTPTGGGGGVGVAPRSKIVLLANFIDLNLSSNFTAFLEAQGINIVYVNASNFSEYKNEKFIVILGGPDAYEGVGEIVGEILDESEQGWLREKRNRGMYVKTNLWRTGQVVIIIAGSDREQTQKACEESKVEVLEKVK
jgi:hypothetical protein